MTTPPVQVHVTEGRERVVPYCRVRDLVRPAGPFSKAKVFAWLRAGRLRAIKLDRLLLIEIESVRELIASGEQWRPQ